MSRSFWLIIFLLFFAALVDPPRVLAQSTAAQVVTGYLTSSGCPTGFTTCFVQFGPSGTSAPYQRTALGYQQIASATLATAQALTVPAGATMADFIPEGTGGTSNGCVRYRDDGTAPTATVGMLLAPAQSYTNYTGALSAIKFILATGATCILNVSYYK